ncbi:alcohol oxidase [Favolaschia claudopus]|uniref:Alcohol oxidase n=1 Tax=Favolaschia claudopus TaxID=2862362 RepID=A0AAW0BTI3_9AGAR
MHSSSRYDIIFAGGGTTACVIAGRLAAADPDLEILIIESGPSTKDEDIHTQPNQWIGLLNRTDVYMAHSSLTATNLNGRSPKVNNGSCVGGGGSVNAMMYNRAPASDYDDWERLGNPGWGAADLIPLARKLETYQIDGSESIHGSSGPIKVSYGAPHSRSKIGADFLSAAAGFPRGREFADEWNDFATCDVYGKFPKYIDAETGRRSDSAHAYLYSQSDNPNLHILDQAHVNRVIFEDKSNRAVGVEYQAGGANSAMLTAYASRLVVVSAGTFGSPAILERSGIGGINIMDKHGIPVVSDLPGVGHNYNDHPGAFLAYLADQGMRKANASSGYNDVDAGIKVRPNGEDLRELPIFSDHRWPKFFDKIPDKSVGPVFSLARPMDSNLDPTNYQVAYFLSYPAGTGTVHITGRDSFLPIEVYSGLLDRDEDLVLLRWFYKWSRELARRMDCYRGENVPEHPRFSEGSEARCGAREGPVAHAAPEIKYTEADNEAIDEFHREKAVFCWHALGSCAMKSREDSGVVDPRLNVYGTKNLKVADMSIAPLNVGANTYHTALLVGEKAAIIIAEELGISGV